MDEGDDARVAALLIAQNRHLDESARHAGEKGRGPVETADNPKVGHARRRAGRHEAGKSQNGRNPSRELGDNRGVEARAEQYADHHRHRRAHDGGRRDGGMNEGCERANRHGAQHPGQGQVELRKRPSACGPERQRGGEAEIREPAGRERA